MKKLAALATVGVLALTGCTTPSPTAAAYVGDTRISQADVDTMAAALAEVTDDPTDTGSAFAKPVVQFVIVSKLARTGAEKAKIVVTDAQRAAVHAANPSLATFAKNPALTTFISDLVDAQAILGTEAGHAAYAEQVASTTVQVNPRIGVWDAKQGAFVDGGSGSISSVAPLAQG